MKKKIIGILVCMLLISTVVLPVSGTLTVDRTSNPFLYRGTLYVGGSGPSNYSTIQDAINDASNGDIVFVYDDSSPYYENVVVDKSIELTGEDKNTTIIDGSGTGSVINITTDTVTVSGFTIQNSGSEYPNSGIYIISNNTIISGNIVQNNYDGIYHYGSNSNTIVSNIVNSNSRRGISMDYSSDNSISMNNVEYNLQTGMIIDAWSSSNTIHLNNVLNNGLNGIQLDDYSNNNRIFGNVIEDNNGYGVKIGDSSDNNIIFHNNLINNIPNAYDECINYWDNEGKGNYWDDYEERYPDAHKKWLKGVWDTPYDIPAGFNQDRYPLIRPYRKSMPYINPFFLQFLEQHPNIFPILRTLLGL